MNNYWMQKNEHVKDGWIYLSPDFRIKHMDVGPTIFPEKDEPKLKCPMCGRIKAVQKREDHLFYCTYCQILFDDRGEDQGCPIIFDHFNIASF